jgi:hypothetical protein
MICGKIIFQTKEEAGVSLTRMNEQKRKGKAKRQPHMVYFCNDCNGYHLSSRRKKNFKKNRTFESHSTIDRQLEQVRKSGNETLKIRNFTI